MVGLEAWQEEELNRIEELWLVTTSHTSGDKLLLVSESPVQAISVARFATIDGAKRLRNIHKTPNKNHTLPINKTSNVVKPIKNHPVSQLFGVAIHPLNRDLPNHKFQQLWGCLLLGLSHWFIQMLIFPYYHKSNKCHLCHQYIPL